MVSQVFMENYELDVSSDISSLITFELDNVRNFASRSTSWSKTVVLPGTARNNKAFGHIFQVGSSNQYQSVLANVNVNFNPAVSAKVIILQNHIQVFKGVMRLLEIVDFNGTREYEVGMFGDISSFLLKMGNKKLEDLDFSAYDHVFSIAGITASWNTINGSGYYYPLMDVGGVSSNKNDYNHKAFRPALYAKEYIDKIFEAAGFTYESALFDTARFKSLVIPYNQKLLRSANYESATANRTSEVEVIDNNPGTGKLPFQTFTSSVWTTNGATDEFTYTGADPATFNFVWEIRGRYLLTTHACTLGIRKNGVRISGSAKVIQPGQSQYLWDGNVDIAVINGDVIDFYYEAAITGDSQSVSAGDLPGAWPCTFTANSLNPVYTEVGVGDDVIINDCIPKGVLQKDFFASIIKLFNLYVYEDKYSSTKIYIKPYVDFYSMYMSDTVDWTYKLNRSKAVRQRPMSQLNSRYYEFKFKEDSDYYNDLYKKTNQQVYGEYRYDSQFEFENEKETVDVIFSPTVLVGYAGEDKVVSTVFKQSSGVEERIDFNIRILQAKKITGVKNWSIKDGILILATQNYYGYAGHYDDPDAPANDIHFGVPAELYFTLAAGAINVTQFNVYWSAYMAEITDKDSRLLSGWFSLKESDIRDLDFSKKVYIDGVLYRLNAIKDYNATNPTECECELLKVNYLVY